MAECHPVGFQWVMEAKARGATVIHIDPRFTRTSAVADLHVPLRAGADIVLLGALVNYVLASEKYFREYVVNYTNAATIISEEFADTEDLDGLFSGFDPEHAPTTRSWPYEGVECRPPPASGTGSVTTKGSNGVGAAGRAGRGARVRRRARRYAIDRPDPGAPPVRVPGTEAAFRPVHAGDGGAGLRHAAGHVRPGLRA